MTLKEFFESLGNADLTEVQTLSVGSYSFSSDASLRLHEIIDNGSAYEKWKMSYYKCENSVYWELIKDGKVVGEIFALPSAATVSVPTALEYAVIEALAIMDDENRATFLKGNQLVILGSEEDTKHFGSLAALPAKHKAGSTILAGKFNSVEIKGDVESKFTKIAASCFASAAETSPLKFKYLEVYRILEARFLHNILSDINTRFLKEPSESLADATDRINSEIKQIVALAKIETTPFENIQQKINGLSSSNRFAASLAHKLEKKGKEFKSPKYAAGADFVYYLRCSIVHAGNKDIIFESFDDAEYLLETIFDEIEYAALLFSGFRLH